jgi:signal transduction histidine kinase
MFLVKQRGEGNLMPTMIDQRDRQLRDLFHLIAVNPEYEPSVSMILKTSRQLLGATGAAFRSTDPDIMVKVGKLGTVDLEMPLGTPDFTALDSTPGVLTCSVRSDESLLGILWLVLDKLSEDQQDTLGVLLDALAIVVERAKAETKFVQAQQLSSALLDSIADSLLVFDADWRLVLMNPAAETIFKAEPGQTLAEVVQSEALTEFVEGQRPLDEWSIDDKTFIPDVHPIGARSNEAWILSLRDITQYKKLNRNQSEFIRIVSHDVRSPLTSMRGFADMMGMVGDLNDKQKQFNEKVLSGINQITALVDNIQDAGLFDIENGFYQLTRSYTDMDEMVRKVVDNQLIPEEKSHLNISVSVSDEVPIINADVNMLERAVANLVDNAVKYTPDGGQVDVRVYTAAESVVVSVRDNGGGMTLEEQKQLFQRHVRIFRPEHKRIKGGGLGLFIVKSIAQRHGGDAWVTSEVGVGSTFYFNIPLNGANLIIPGSEENTNEAAD